MKRSPMPARRTPLRARTPLKQRSANRLDLLAALCPPCHAHVHDHPEESYRDGWLIHYEEATA